MGDKKNTRRYFLFVIQLFLTVFIGTTYAGFTNTKIGPQPIWNATHTDKLRQDLLLNYDKFARPAQHFNATTVKFGLTFRHFELNEFKSTLLVHAWLRLLWNDEKLKWNPKDYGDLSTLNLADHEIWQPDLFLYNSATSTSINHYSNTHCIVYPDGEVLWVPPAQFTVLCNLNLKYWPFDTQTCSLKFGSWTYNGDQIDLQVYNNETTASIELLVDNLEWNVLDTSVTRNEKYYSCCTEAYPDISISLTIYRRSPAYKAIIITPAIAIIFLTLSVFWFPPSSGEKIILNATNAVLICIFLLYFTQKIPAMGNHTPLIVLFYTSCLYIVTFTMIGSVVVIWLSRTNHSNGLPWTIKKPLTGSFGKLLGLDNYIQQTTISSQRVTAEEMRDHQVTDFEESSICDEQHIIKPVSKNPIQQDWILLAAAIDRISFCFYSILFAILSLVYSL